MPESEHGRYREASAWHPCRLTPARELTPNNTRALLQTSTYARSKNNIRRLVAIYLRPNAAQFLLGGRITQRHPWPQRTTNGLAMFAGSRTHRALVAASRVGRRTSSRVRRLKGVSGLAAWAKRMFQTRMISRSRLTAASSASSGGGAEASRYLACLGAS